MLQEVNSMLKSQLEAKQKLPDNLKYMIIHTSKLQEEILTLKSKLDIRQKELENSIDIKIFTDLQEECSGLKSQLQNQVKESEKLKEEKSKLATQLRAKQKIWKDIDDMKVCTKVLKEENSDLKSLLGITRKLLKNSEAERKQYFNKYSELRDKERHDIAIQTDMVCT